MMRMHARRWRPSARALAVLAAAGMASSLVGVAALPVGVVPTAVADKRSDAQQDKEEAQRKQAELMSSLEGVSAELGQAYLDLQAANAELSSAETDLAARQREAQAAADRLGVAQAQLDDLNEQAAASQAESDANRAALSSLVVSTYQGDSSLSAWTYVLASDSVEDLTDRASTMEVASSIQESVLAAVDEQRAQDANRQARQEATTQRVSELRDQADQARAAAQEQRDTVAAKQAQAQAATDALEQRKADEEAQLKQARADEQAADATLAELDARLRQQAAAQGQTVAPAGSPATSLGSGSIGRPITGPLIVTSRFGMRFHPILHYTRLHDGVDLAAATGVPQYAAISGTARTSYDSSCGNAVFLSGIVDGNSVVIKYCHLSRQSVSSGQQVSKGQQIGLTGSTGGVTGPHVHFSVRINGQYIDPMTLPGF